MMKYTLLEMQCNIYYCKLQEAFSSLISWINSKIIQVHNFTEIR